MTYLRLIELPHSISTLTLAECPLVAMLSVWSSVWVGDALVQSAGNLLPNSFSVVGLKVLDLLEMLQQPVKVP